MTEEELQKIIANEMFVELMRAAMEDDAIRAELLFALRSDDLTRMDIVRRWLQSGSERKAPEKFNEALGYLMHREIAMEAIRLLS